VQHLNRETPVSKPKPPHGTLADLMWMGKRVYPVTFAKTQSVEQAIELLDERDGATTTDSR